MSGGTACSGCGQLTLRVHTLRMSAVADVGDTPPGDDFVGAYCPRCARHVMRFIRKDYVRIQRGRGLSEWGYEPGLKGVR